MAQSLIKLNADTPAIQYLCRKDKHLAKVIRMIGPIEYRPAENGYWFLVREIMGQMLSNKVAAVFVQRLLDLTAQPITPAKIAALTDQQLRTVGISNSKVRYIRNLTTAIQSRQLVLANLATEPDTAVLKSLTAVKGIGNWSAKMYLIFVLDRPNVLPYEDVAFLQGYGWMWNTHDYKKQSVVKRGRKWSPYASIAVRYMYRALDLGLTKQQFHLFKN